MKKLRFIITFIISIIIFSFIFNTAYKKINGEDNILTTDNEETIPLKDKDKINFLVVGIDAYDNTDAKGQRTDTMILAQYNFRDKKMNLLSIPRDTRVKKDNGYYDKINHAHAYGGMDYTMDAVRKLTNLDLKYYVRMDYRAVEEIVDTIGGVNIYVPQRMLYDDTTEGKEFHVDLYEGQQVLNGDQSIQFLRWRKNNDKTGYAEGDVGRIKAQQEFIKALVKQSLKAKNITKIPKMIKIYNEYIDTNIPLNTVVRGGLSGIRMNFDNINTHTLPGSGQYINNISYFVYDVDKSQRLINDIFN